jgi:hypothetical protein
MLKRLISLGVTDLEPDDFKTPEVDEMCSTIGGDEGEVV